MCVGACVCVCMCVCVCCVRGGCWVVSFYAFFIYTSIIAYNLNVQ